LDGSAEGVEYWLENELTPLGAVVGVDGLDGTGEGEEDMLDEEVEAVAGMAGVEGWDVADGAGGGGGVFFGRTPSPGAAGNGTAFGSVVAVLPPAPVSVAWPLRD
jgi:hypothetical protein